MPGTVPSWFIERMKFRTMFLVIALITLGASVAGFTAELSDDQVKAEIIKQSIATYPGRCPCPYNLDSSGRQCGGRSAWSKPGGAAPLCYPADITPDMVEDWRAKRSLVKA